MLHESSTQFQPNKIQYRHSEMLYSIRMPADFLPKFWLITKSDQILDNY